MAYNFLELANTVCYRVNETPLTSSNFASASGHYNNIKDSINSAIRHINQQETNWPFNHCIEEETLTTGVSRYDFPYNAKQVDFDTFRIKSNATLGNKTQHLDLINYEDYIRNYVKYEHNPSASQGVPKLVTRAQGLEFVIIPPPNAAYRLEYEYYMLPNDLEKWNDVPTIPEQFRYVIVDGALYYNYLFRGDSQTAALILDKFVTGIDQMRTIYINRQDRIVDTRIGTNRAPSVSGAGSGSDIIELDGSDNYLEIE